MTTTFGFPAEVSEAAARVVAAGVVLMGLTFLATGSGLVLLVLSYGFLARVIAGPTLSPLGQIATRLVTPRLPGPHRQVPGPPKRFAQAVGLTFSVGAGAAWAIGAHTLAFALIGGLVLAAALESAFALCLGCIVYERIWGCADCADMSTRLASVASTPAVAVDEPTPH